MASDAGVRSWRPEPEIEFGIEDAAVIMLTDCGLYWGWRNLILLFGSVIKETRHEYCYHHNHHHHYYYY